MVSVRGCRRGRLFKGSHSAVKARCVRGPDSLAGLLQGGFSRIFRQIRAMARYRYDHGEEGSLRLKLQATPNVSVSSYLSFLAVILACLW